METKILVVEDEEKISRLLEIAAKYCPWITTTTIMMMTTING